MKPMGFPVAALFAAFSSWSMAQQATDEAVLATVKINADRQLLDRDESASPVRVLGRAELDARPAKDVTEALAQLPNVNIRRSGGPSAEPSLGMYGISAQPRSSSSTTLAIDGVPLNNGMFPEASLNMLPLSLVERIEVIQGPASSAYGNNARLGVVNLVTRQPRSFGGEVAASVAKWDTTSASGYLGGAIEGGGRYLAGIEQRHTAGHLQPKGSGDFSDALLDNFAVFADKSVSNAIVSAAYVRYAWDRNDPSYLVQPGAPAGSNPVGTAVARAESGKREHFHLGADWYVADQVRAGVTYTWNDYDEQTRRNTNYGTPSGGTGPVNQQTVANGLLGKVDWDTGANLLTVGIEHQNGTLTDRVANTETTGRATGYFIQDRYLSFQRQLSLSAGYRVDKFSFYDETSKSPKLGFSWKPANANWLVRGNASRAFSAPSFNQLFGALGNAKLIASTFDLREIGFESRPTKNLTVGATVFGTKTIHPIFPRPRNQNPVCAPGPGNCFVNVGDTPITRGVTLDFRHDIAANWQWGGSQTWLDPRENTFATAGHVLKLDTIHRLGAWTLSADLQRETQRYFQDNHLSPFPDFTVVNAAVEYRFANGLKLAARAENLTNRAYATTQIVSSNFAFPALPIYRPERFVTLQASLPF